jgi:hypothetical protein
MIADEQKSYFRWRAQVCDQDAAEWRLLQAHD